MIPTNDSQNIAEYVNKIETYMRLATHLAKAPFYQKLGAEAILAIIMTALEMGLKPMECLNGGMHSVDGKITMSAQLMNSLILRAGHKIKTVRLSSEVCTLRFYRHKDTDFSEYTYTIEDAKRANLTGKAVWRNNPRDMLFARALSGGARKFFPDVIGPHYVPGETDSATDDNIKPDIDAALLVEDKNAKIEDFISRLQIVEGSLIMEYVDFLASERFISRMEMLEKVCEYEDSFVKLFDKWQKKLALPETAGIGNAPQEEPIKESEHDQTESGIDPSVEIIAESAL